MITVRAQLSLEDAQYALSVIGDELRLALDDGVDENDPARESLERVGASLLRAVERGESKLGIGHRLGREYQDQRAVRALIRWAFEDEEPGA